MYRPFDSLRWTAHSLGLVIVGILSTLGALSLAQVSPTQAASPGVSSSVLLARLKADEATIAALQAKAAPFSLSTDTTRSDGRTNTELTIARVNVHIVSGSGSTSDSAASHAAGTALTGLGNLIIGYNGPRDKTALRNNAHYRDVRTGSHNLILGDQNNYSSYGGLVVGSENTISGEYASVSGGFFNTASAPNASASGGDTNTASAPYASVSGGGSNTASSESSSVSGGLINMASGKRASVSGGRENMASGDSASVSGGSKVTAKGSYDDDSDNASGNGKWDSSGPTWGATTLSGH